MQVEVLRKDGEILFIETSSDLIGLLSAWLHEASIGAIVALT